MNVNTLEYATEQRIKKHIASVKFYIREGMTLEQAIEILKSNSVLGDKTWERIKSEVKKASKKEVMKVKIHVYGKNKPILRGFDKDGNYKEFRTASYSGHRIAKSLIEAQKYIQDYLNRNWDVQIEVETQKATHR